MNRKNNFLQKIWVVCPLAMICCGLWGSAFPVIKIGYQIFDITAEKMAQQIVFAGYRLFMAGILGLLIGSLTYKKPLFPQNGSWKKIFVLCILQTGLQSMFSYIGLAHTTGVKASIIEGVNVFVAIIVASILFRQEKLTKRKIFGCLIGFCGIVLVNLAGGSGIDLNFKLQGEGFIFLSTVADAFAAVCLKKYSETEKPVILSSYQFILGGVIMSACGWLMGGAIWNITLLGAGILIYLASASAVAYFIWGILIKYNPISMMMIFVFMTPIFGVTFSALFLGERSSLNWASIVSLVLVCIGIYVVNGNTSKDTGK